MILLNKQIEGRDKDKSFVIPSEIDLSYFNEEAWVVKEMKPQSQGALICIEMSHTSPDYSYAKYHWEAVEADFNQFGGGTVEGWIDYVSASFFANLREQKAVYLETIRNGLSNALNSSTRNPYQR